MGREKKQAESDDSPSAPIWLLSFGDCMTNLLTFFVLLVTFSSFDKNIAGTFSTVALGIRKAFFVPLTTDELDKSAFLPTNQIWAIEELDQGSEKPTLERGEQDRLKEETEPVDFRSRKVFLIASEKVFWGRGSVISFQGREVLAAMALFLKQVPNRVVISENGPADQSSDQFGLHRAWAVREYLVEKQQLNKSQFSISAASTMPKEGFESDQLEAVPERMLEIVLLERSIYN